MPIKASKTSKQVELQKLPLAPTKSKQKPAFLDFRLLKISLHTAFFVCRFPEEKVPNCYSATVAFVFFLYVMTYEIDEIKKKCSILGSSAFDPPGKGNPKPGNVICCVQEYKNPKMQNPETQIQIPKNIHFWVLLQKLKLTKN